MDDFCLEWYKIYVDYGTFCKDLYESDNIREVIMEIKILQKDYTEKLKIDKWVHDAGNGYPEPVAEIDYDCLLDQV